MKDRAGERGSAGVRERESGDTPAWPLLSSRVPKSRGFSLLEVVIALAIVGVGITLALQLFSGALKNVRKIDFAGQAMNHAENVMNEILSDETIKGPIARHDDIDDNFRWEAIIQDFEIPEQSQWDSPQPFPMKLLHVRVDVIYKKDKNGKLYRLSCLKLVGLRPTNNLGVTTPFGNIQGVPQPNLRPNNPLRPNPLRNIQ